MNNRGTLHSLFHAYRDDLTRFITSKFGDPDDAEDVVQDTFHNVLKIDDLSQVDNPRAYLYQTAQNLALNRLRKAKRHIDYVNHAEADEQGPPLEREFAAHRDLSLIDSALKKLPARTREVFVKSRLDDKPYRAIAEELNVSVSSVEKHMIKALQILRETVQADTKRNSKEQKGYK